MFKDIFSKHGFQFVEEKDGLLVYSKPHINNDVIVVVKASNTYVITLEDCNGDKVFDIAERYIATEDWQLEYLLTGSTRIT